MPTPNYQHTQSAPLQWILYLVAVALGVAAWLERASGPALVAALLIGAGVFVLLALCFGTLTVTDRGEALVARFGPLPLFGVRVPYAEIESAEQSRTGFIDGWGIHWLPGRGWVYNLWGFECVRMVVRGRVVRIGTDDAAGLVAFVRKRALHDGR